MTTIDEIENAVGNLSPDELASFRKWYAEFDAEVCDARLERDAAGGMLDFLVKETLDCIQVGRTNPR